MLKKKSSIAIALLLLGARAPAVDAGSAGRGRGARQSPPPTASAIRKLRGGGQPPPATAAAALATFAEDRPLLTAFLSCAANGLAADCVAQRSEARGRRRSAARREAAAHAALRAGGGGEVAFVSVNATSAHHHVSDGRGVSTPPSAAAALSSALVERTKGPSLEQPFRWDARRSLAFVLYGGCYQGVACHLFYNVLFLRWFGPGRAWTKVAVSQFVLAPLLTLPCAYVFRGVVFGKSARQTLQEYVLGVTQNGLLASFWKLWIPIQFLIFTVIPVHLRIPFSSVFSFLWTVILSCKTNHS